MMIKRDDEEYCRQEFSKYLEKISPSSPQTWTPIDQSEEPPDFELNLGGVEYAIEVTTLMEKVEVGDLKLPPIGITQSLWNIARKVEKEATERGKLHGAYYIGFLIPVPSLTQVRDEIASFLLEYIERTFAEEKADEADLTIDHHQVCFIAKVFDSKTIVQIGGPAFAKWEGEASLPICHILQVAITDKKYKVRFVQKPIILLLLDMYSFAEGQAIKRCVSDLRGLESFHSVFVARPSGSHLMLWSVNPEWSLD